MRSKVLYRIGRDVDELPAVPLSRPMRVSRLGYLIPPNLRRAALSSTNPPGGAGAEPSQSSLDPSTTVEPAQVGEYWSSVFDPAVQSTLPEVEDGRVFHPESTRPLRRVSGRAVRRMQSAGAVLATFVPDAIEVPARDSVIMCIRRKSRRGVILALGHGGGFHRPPRRSPNSEIWC